MAAPGRWPSTQPRRRTEARGARAVRRREAPTPAKRSRSHTCQLSTRRGPQHDRLASQKRCWTPSPHAGYADPAATVTLLSVQSVVDGSVDVVPMGICRHRPAGLPPDATSPKTNPVLNKEQTNK